MNLPKLLLNNDLTTKFVEFCNSKGLRNYLTQFEEIFKKGLEIECKKDECLDTTPTTVIEQTPQIEPTLTPENCTVDQAIELLDSFLKEHPEYVGDITEYLSTNYVQPTLDEEIEPVVETIDLQPEIEPSTQVEEKKPTKKPAAKKQPSPKKGITSKIKK